MRKLFTVLLWMILASVLAVAIAEAQQAKKVQRIGFLGGGSPSAYSPRIEAFRKGLAEIGYAEGKNIAIEYRYAEGNLERLPDLAAELVRLKVDVILAAGGREVAQAAKQATTTIPVVITNVGDPVATRLVASLARPGGNITGLTSASPDLSAKRLELLKEAVPRLTRVAVLYDPTNRGNTANFKETEVAAHLLGVKLQSLEVRIPDDFAGAFNAAKTGRAGALIVLPSLLNATRRTRIVELATKSRLPTMFAEDVDVESGGLMSYGPNYPDLFRRAATYVDKILKGAKPGDLPVEQPMKFELVINLKAAKQIGLTIPPNVLARADRVIR